MPLTVDLGYTGNDRNEFGKRIGQAKEGIVEVAFKCVFPLSPRPIKFLFQRLLIS
jgi:hypothetical protein